MAFRDSWGLIVTQSGDGGDSLRYESCFWLAHYLRGKLQLSQPYSRLSPEQVIHLVEVLPGVVVRHPDPTQWWSQPKNTSRDQTLGAFIIAQLYDKEFLARLVKAHSKRWWFCSNGTDNLWFTSVVHRARGGVFNVLLYITDWFLLFDFFVAIGWIPTYNDGKKKWTWYDPDNVGFYWNAVLAMVQPGHNTFIRTAIRWIWANFCRKNLGSEAFNETHPIAAGLLWESRNDTADLSQMWQELIYRYFPRWMK